MATWRAQYAAAAARGDLEEMEQLKNALGPGVSVAATKPFCDDTLVEINTERGQTIVESTSSTDASGALRADADVVPALQHLRQSETILAQILERAGLRTADGRALYRYSVDDSSFEVVKARLKLLHEDGRLPEPSSANAALFVLYVAEWFRREYAGNQYSWRGPLHAVNGHLRASTIKALTREGLNWWGRAPRRMAGGEMRLLSLVLEGGFPTRLLEMRERGRIAVHLRRLIACLETRTSIDEEAATALSRTAGSTLGTFDHDEFHVLCAEMALAVTALKREAGAAPPGISVCDWLDLSQPDWREKFPIGLTNNSARRLLDDLVNDATGRICGDAGCHRLLLREGERWVASLALELQGEIELPTAWANPSEGRIHLFAASTLASVLAGEIGLLDPPTEPGQRWLSRRRGSTLAPIPFPLEQPVKVELRTAERRQLIVKWPGGDALRSDVLVFGDIRGDDECSQPQSLVYLGSGSLSTRRQRAWLLVPSNFVVCPVEAEALTTPISRGSKDLYEISRTVHVGPPGQIEFRIEVGTHNDHTRELVLDGPILQGAEAADGTTIFAGTPRIKLRSGPHNRALEHDCVVWRLIGTSTWRDWLSQAPDVSHENGLIDVVWRDPKSRVPFDRQRCAIVPAGAGITARPRGENGVVYGLENLEGWSLANASNQVTSRASPDCLEIVFDGRPVRRLTLTLSSSTARLVIVAPAPVVGGGFCSADGSLLDNGARVTLDELRGGVAFSSGQDCLHLVGPHGSNGQFALFDELPLWAVSEEIVRLLSASNGLDDVVTLELVRGKRRLVVGRYAATLAINQKREVSLVPELPAGQMCRLDWLSVATAQRRILSQGVWPQQLPDDLEGPGIVIPRQGTRVIGRPTLTLGRPLITDGLGPLQRATLIPRGGERRAIIAHRLARLADDTLESAADRSFLLALIAVLDGTPPAAIDALAMLPMHLVALASLAATAETQEVRNQVWLLERELPFLWAAVPLELWTVSFSTRYRVLERTLSVNGFEGTAAAGVATSSVKVAAETLAEFDPMLRTALALAVGVAPSIYTGYSLKDGIQDRLRHATESFNDRSGLTDPQRGNVSATSCFRRPGSALAERLPAFQFDDSYIEDLDAPCALAFAAASSSTDSRRVILDAEQVRRARDARARDPQSFADIYSSALMLLARGASLTL
jgi:hypothetical protein